MAKRDLDYAVRRMRQEQERLHEVVYLYIRHAMERESKRRKCKVRFISRNGAYYFQAMVRGDWRDTMGPQIGVLDKVLDEFGWSVIPTGTLETDDGGRVVRKRGQF